MTNLCYSCTNIRCEFQSGIVRTKCAFYMPPTVEAIPKAGYETRLKADMTDVLDKIRAEIDHDMQEAPYMYDDEHLDELHGYEDGLEHTLNIIDKYRTESEG